MSTDIVSMINQTIRVVVSLVLFVIVSSVYAFISKPVITLVYKDVGNPPYMNRAPDDSGLYEELYTRVADFAGAKLKIRRMPKKRTYHELEGGMVDIYPSGVFHEFRSKFLFYIPNGLYRSEIYTCLTHQNNPNIRSLRDFNINGLVWAIERGSSLVKLAVKNDLRIQEVTDLDIKKAIKMISEGRPIVYSAVTSRLKKYLKRNGLDSLEPFKIKVHKNCRPPNVSPLFTGFSRRSKHYKEVPNPDYNPKLPLSVDNFPVMLDTSSFAYKFMVALRKLHQTGEVRKLAKKYGVSYQ